MSWLPAGYSLLLTLLITAPLLRPGYLLLRDAVSTPRSYPTDTALGLGDAAPRAVPQDWLLATLSPVIDGGLIVKIILFAALWAAGYGAAVLVRELLGAPLAAQLVATTLVVWNPYIAERLLQGHWSLLTGYAALPWTASAALRLRTAGHSGFERFRNWSVLAGCLAAAGLTPTGALLAGTVALLVAGPRRSPGVLVLMAVTSAPWLVATAASGVAAEPSDPAGVTAFAARAEPWLATVGSLAGLGGIWNAEAVPVSRTTPIAALATILLLAVVALGIRRVVAADGDPDRTRARRVLIALAGAAVLVPALTATPAGLTFMEWLVVEVPGAGLLRDTQKFVALAAPGYALCAAAACLGFAGRSREGEVREESAGPTGARTGPADGPARWSPALAALFIGVLTLPLLDLGWGADGQLRAIGYPDSWHEIAERIDGPGDIAVLPGGMFRRFPYSGSAPVLDPAPRMLPRDVLQTGALPVHDLTVTGEGARAQTVENLLLDGGPPDQLAQLGVGWVLVERDTPGPLGNSAATLARLRPVHSTGELALYQVPDVRPRPAPAHRSLVVAAHILWALLLVIPLATYAYGALIRRARR
ncbi:hypothetical protein [Nocardia jinanensis]|uniref:Cyclic nucleotide-binding domain-containing protein n=1 Tax=Nocardia jinanensis TaxID=382504 RepID=A0A917RYE3_9NOCA|nr:hypothetical protein [Nocardia jinanensis]GGL42096.1 hypothetical protein GCM10011588_66070 [Nocardia jinanensis]